MFGNGLEGLHDFKLIVRAFGTPQHGTILTMTLIGNFSLNGGANIFKKFLFFGAIHGLQDFATNPEFFFLRTKMLQNFFWAKGQQLFPNAARKRRGH